MDCEKYRKRSKQIKIRLCEEEYKKIQDHAEASGKNVNSLLRETYFRRTIDLNIVHGDELKKINWGITRIGHNIHQIVRALNSGGAFDLKDLGKSLAEISVMQEMIANKLWRS
ncbi:MAG: hypothetical protein H8D23_35800 [Candidatus Brocadiales bacterium]|nr:hypothetical protein [Candidatus Brocadiales bacterium]